ncbi:exostosin-like 3 isoform X2 [Mya arenaria]|uniref:exostosin-like 3 isoform X2 n=1 Tax=Mya arenaria TaxID=6604 RepID=UPI0022DFDD88|nr:exostosin-like 3 isoform X2 [Mya arenaria]
MDGGFPGRKRRFFHNLLRSRLGQLILCLLVILIVSPLVFHYYISNIGSETSNGSRSTKDHDEGFDLDKVQCNDLKNQITELRRIKASVNNELRDLESRRLAQQTEISKQKTTLEALRIQQENIEKEIKQSKMNLEQLKVEEDEFSNGAQPLIKAPILELLPNLKVRSQKNVFTSLSEDCTMNTCFDYSRCSLLSGFPVYVYEIENNFKNNNLEEFIKTSVFHAFDGSSSIYLTTSPDRACVFVAILGETFSKENSETVQSRINALQHWNGDGTNHVLVNLAKSTFSFDIFYGVNTGRAIIVQSSFVETFFRGKFDIVVSPVLGSSDGELWSELPPLNPIRRSFLLSFEGQFSDISNLNSDEVKHTNEGDQNFRSRNLNAALGSLDKGDNSKDIVKKLFSLEASIVQHLKNVEEEAKEKVLLNFMCNSDQEKVGINGEWSICGDQSHRTEMLKQATFSILIAPANYSVVTTTVFQTRLFESLKSGAVPVILGEYVELPFSELIDWSRTVIMLPKQRVTELYFVLRTFSNVDIMEFKRNGRMFWETFLGTTKSVVSMTLAVLRTRLNIPAKAVREEPSENSVSNFIPVAQHIAPEPEEDTDEVLGPIEPPFPSTMFKQNYTVWTMKDVFNQPGDPFHLLPFSPFEKILPSDSKFYGAGVGFRPINKGEGGSGKEFSEALGGNHPREQFTMVMLTYERSDVLIKAITRLKGLPYLNKVIVVWNNPSMPSENLGWPEIGVPVVVIKMAKNSLNNRFLPFEAIETEAVLSIDDDSHLRHDEIVFGFRVWREERDRIVGFPGRYHAWDPRHGGWHYNSNYTCEMSMVITGAAFFHKYYSYLYSYTMAATIREKVDEYMNCEDIAMNFLVSHITRKPPVKVTSRWTFRCPGCPQQLALDESHFTERHKCMNFFVEIYGYMPLMYTQYRVDSILFKTRISHDKQKCFKYI